MFWQMEVSSMIEIDISSILTNLLTQTAIKVEFSIKNIEKLCVKWFSIQLNICVSRNWSHFGALVQKKLEPQNP